MSELNEFGRLLVSIVSLYLVYYFSRILYYKGLDWVLSKYLIAGILIFGSIAVQSWYAALARHLGSNPDTYHPVLDEYRGWVNFLYCIPFVIGAYMYESETREIKDHKRMVIIYVSMILLSAWIVW